MPYRHYLLDAAGCICAAAYFSTSDYTEARAVAASLAETGSDVWSEYDLWQGTRHLSWAPERVRKDVVVLRFDLQRRVVEFEEVLNELRVSAARSRRRNSVG